MSERMMALKKHRQKSFPGWLGWGLLPTVIAGLICLIFYRIQVPRPTEPKVYPQISAKSRYDNLALGIPGKADTIIDRPGYALGYIEKHEQPAWVVYKLTRSEVIAKAVKRTNRFVEDPAIPTGSATAADYRRSGYDRGHLAPAADMAFSLQTMKDSFYYSNMSPQRSQFNRGIWKDLEEQARDWAGHYGRVYIACGPIVTSGFQTIGDKRKIAVPTAFFKVFLRQTATGWAAVGFVMQNVAGSKPLMTYMQSIDAVEKQTNLDFFYQLPDSIETLVEAEYDVSEWTLPRRK